MADQSVALGTAFAIVGMSVAVVLVGILITRWKARGG